ncbi:MAG TPA: hypothetical protein VM687_05285 [Stenotrophomonas sp.]|nr:hypothetical protein [Stenotrophomonas sp.]
MSDLVDQEKLLAAMVALSARLDALTWAVGALIDSHPNPAGVLAAWNARLDQASAGGFEAGHAGYRERYAQELAAWTQDLEIRAKARQGGDQ